MTTLRLIYRLYGGQNLKCRPQGFDKLTCLGSFLAAAEQARRTGPVDVTVLCDGPIPASWRELAVRHARVVDVPGGPIGMRRSYLAAIRLAVRSAWPGDDLVYLSEDDYLFQPDAFTKWVAAERLSLPANAYVALYASTPDYPADGPGQGYGVPTGWRPAPAVAVGGCRWVNVPSTTSSFGARAETLRADAGVFFQGTLPSPRRILDHATLLTLQGHPPFSRADLLSGPDYQKFGRGPRAVVQNGVLLPFRLALNLRALARRPRPHRLYAPEPNLACHQEIPHLSPGTDWDALRARAVQWIAEQPTDPATTTYDEAR